MLERPFWTARIAQAWREAPIAWVSGVRRTGKTTLARSLDADGLLYFDCDDPAVCARARDPLQFIRSWRAPVVVLDEVHQLDDPSRLLKISADRFPGTRILATGSSTLAATHKFRDSLTGRKRTVHLTPVTWEELPTFGSSIEKRLLHGGLPGALLAGEKQPSLYREWLDSFFARDIQRLFGFRSFDRFNAFFEYVLRSSGGQLDLSAAARELGVARPTVGSHLAALEVTHAATVVRPFHGSSRGEITRSPRIYAFDTGFVSFARGWDRLRPADLGVLWEHVLLEQIQAKFPLTPPRFWRTKSGREVDFVLPRNRDRIDAIECKWSADAFDPAHMKAFRAIHPSGRNYLVTPATDAPRTARFGELHVTVCGPDAVGL